ncbi:MAG: YHYH protein [Magnetococcales bacterium]|nr:YHYH protein [Magnetococcales bacterium]
MSRKQAAGVLLLSALLGTVAVQTVDAKTQISTSTTNLTINGVSMAVYTVQSDGTPFYGTNNAAGFPTSGTSYLHTPSAQSYTFYIPAAPTLAGTAASPVYTPLGLSNSLGVAFDGVPYDPLTSNCNGSKSTSNSCTFRIEGRLQTDTATASSAYGTGRLGFDVHNGHSQSNGSYHYHSIPCGISTGGSALISCSPMVKNNTWTALPSTATVVGYARDGFPIVVQNGVTANYAVVSAAASGRPSTNPVDSTNQLGNWSADMMTLLASGSTTFTQANLPANKTFGDFVYKGPSTLGTSSTALGLCNEAPNTNPNIKTLAGVQAAYVYYLTPNFPMVPRCLIGVTDAATATTQGFYHAGSYD